MDGWGNALSRDARLWRAFLATGLALVFGWILVPGPEGLPVSHCLFREFTGISCLTCGMTRSLQAASHGHLQAAFQFHLMGPLVLAGMVSLALTCVVEAGTGKQLLLLRSTIVKRFLFLGAMTIWLVFGVTRALAELF